MENLSADELYINLKNIIDYKTKLKSIRNFAIENGVDWIIDLEIKAYEEIKQVNSLTYRKIQ